MGANGSYGWFDHDGWEELSDDDVEMVYAELGVCRCDSSDKRLVREA